MMSALLSDSHGVPKDAHLSKMKVSYRRLVRKWRLNVDPLSVPQPSLTSTALVSAALTTAAPVFTFESRNVPFVPKALRPSSQIQTRAISVSQSSFFTAPEGGNVPSSSPPSSPVGVPQCPYINVRATSSDRGFVRSSSAPDESTQTNTSKETSNAVILSHPASPTSHLLEVPLSPQSPRQSIDSRQNYFNRRPSTSVSSRNVSQNSWASQATFCTVNSQISLQNTEKFKNLLLAMSNLVNRHMKHLRRPILSNFSTMKSPKEQCRDTLASFQKEIHAISQRQATDATDTLYYQSLRKLYHELRESLFNLKRDLSTGNISDAYCKEFCDSITMYGRRLGYILRKT